MKKLIKINLNFLKYIWRKYNKIKQINNLNLKFNCYIVENVDIHIQYDDDISIGEGVYIGAFSTIHVVNQKDKRNSKLIIGKGTAIGELNNIRAGGGTIVIGENCILAQYITIVSSNHETKRNKIIKYQDWTEDNNFVIIGDDVWIGANVVILPGVTIGNGAVIGAGSIVTKNIPKYAIAFGAPCKVVGQRK